MANTARELEHEAREAHVRIWTDAAAARWPDLRRERRHQTDGDKVLLAAAEREEPGTQDREDPWHSRSRRLDDEASGWENVLKMLCDLLNIKHIGGRPSSAPKLTIATEYISRASRAQGAMTLVKQAAAKENRCHSGAERETWIHGYSDDGLLDGSWMHKRGYRDLLHSYGSDIGMAETEEESVRRWTVERKLWRKADALKTSRRTS